MFFALTTGEARDAINNVRKKSDDSKSMLKIKQEQKERCYQD